MLKRAVLWMMACAVLGCQQNKAHKVANDGAVFVKPGEEVSHEHHPHLGEMAPFYLDYKMTGYAELKLHDDKGDLELWLTRDAAGEKPFLMSLETKVTAAFPSLDKEVTLQVRNMKNNEDEEGEPNIQKGKTHYFIFPGKTGADAQWLQGKAFSAQVVLRFQEADKVYWTKPFLLKPHVH